MPVIEYGNKSTVVTTKIEDWEKSCDSEYRIEFLTTRDDDGEYSTIALNLPGAGSCGSRKEDSIANAKEAVKAVIETYKVSGDEIPWKEVTSAEIVGGDYKVIWIDA